MRVPVYTTASWSDVDRDHLLELIATEQHYWWHVAKRELVVELLHRHFPPPARLVEAGIGGAGNLAAFRALGYHVSGLDVLPESVDRGRAIGIAEVHVHDIEQPWPIAPRSADAVVMLDVLEHLRQPVTALRHASVVLAPGGGIVVSVPAGPWLTSSWDDLLGHHRRYTSAMLRAQAVDAGLRLVRLSHWNSFSLPAAAVLRLSERWFRRRRSTAFPRMPGIVSDWLLRCARAERALIRRMPIPFGLSLVGVLSK